MSRTYSTLGRQILITLKRGKPLSLGEIYDTCCMSNREQITEQLSGLIGEGKVEKLTQPERYAYVCPTKNLTEIVDRFAIRI